MALAARPSDVLRLIVSQALRLVLLGIVVGLAGCFALGRLFQQQLYEVSAFDPLLLSLTCAGLVVVALAASLLPALRAIRVDPMVALRVQ